MCPVCRMLQHPASLLAEVSKFQHHAKPYSKCSTSLVQFVGETCLLLVESCFVMKILDFNFIIRYHATKIVEVIYSFWLFLININCTDEDCFEILLPYFFHIDYHSMVYSNFSYSSFSVFHTAV